MEKSQIVKSRIKAISVIENDDVYDISVADNNNFFANNILVHNCGEVTMCADGGTFEYWEHDKKITLEHFGDICNLGNINLVSYVFENGFDFCLMNDDIDLLVRALDNVIDISGYPLETIKNAAKIRRKIGCGSMGYASMLYMMGLRFGSKEALAFSENLWSKKINMEYQASALLAKEKGAFPMWSDDCLDNGYLKNGNLSCETLELVKEYGLRNSQLSTVAPTGTTSIFMGLVSGGIEPVFEKEYWRWITYSHRTDEVIAAGYDVPDYSSGKLEPNDTFKLINKGNESILESKDGVYRIDKSRGLIKRILCEDYGYKWCRENLTSEKFKEYENNKVFATANELDMEEHANSFIQISSYCDLSVSKTVNLKNDYPYDDFVTMYVAMWKAGVRGCTTYREGTMAGVLEVKKDAKQEAKEVKKQTKDFLAAFDGHDENIIFTDVKLPDEYPSKGYVIKTEGVKFYINVAFKDKGMKKPFAIFVSTNNREKNVITFDAIEKMEELAKNIGIGYDKIAAVNEKISGQQNVVKIARYIGFLLRHNVPIYDICLTLDQVPAHAGSFVFRIKKFLMEFVEEIDEDKLPVCNKCGGKLRFSEGCFVCTECGNSRCG